MSDTPKEDWDNEAFNEACRLVGHFMHHWALLEGTMNSGVAKLLGMSALEGAIATANMQCRSKIHVLTTLINLFGEQNEWVRSAVKTMEAIGNMASKRNTVAHVTFAPHPKGVEFMPVKAKGKFALPDTIWTTADFRAHNSEMHKLWGALDDIIKKMSALRAIMKETNAPKNALSGLGLGGALSHLLQGTPDFLEPSPGECPQTETEQKK